MTEKLDKLTQNFPVVVLTGSRQCGKSTLLEHMYGKKSEIVIFDPLNDIENAKSDPELFLRSHQCPLILDEIQYVPEIIPSLKRRIDKDRKPGQYILTGSQQWQVMRSLAESLAGRAAFCDLDNFSLLEVNQKTGQKCFSWLNSFLDNPEMDLKLIKRFDADITLTEQLWRGFLPECQFMQLDIIPAFHEAYIRTYIERDIRLLENIGELRQFRRFYQLSCAMTAQEINYNQLGRDIGISPHTAQKWMSVLKSTFQIEELSPFSRNILKRISKKTKVHMTDTGLICHNLAIASPSGILGHPAWGAIFESACVMDLIKQCRLLNPQPVLYHWRTHAGAEIDLLIEYNGTFYPIEIKSSSNPDKHDTRGFRAFRETYPDIRTGPGFIIAPVEKMWQISELDYVVPWDGCVINY